MRVQFVLVVSMIARSSAPEKVKAILKHIFPIQIWVSKGGSKGYILGGLLLNSWKIVGGGNIYNRINRPPREP